MLHELLFALSGHTGDIFVLNENNEISVATNLPFIHPAEESTLSKLCKLANYYLKLKTFISDTNDYFNGSAGIYSRSFARGLELCVEPYQRLIIDLERELLHDPYLTFAHVVARTEEYQMVFPMLVKLTEEVAQDKVHGCAILDLLYKSSICGIPSNRKAVLKILQVCHRTMFKQLTSWLLHGLLYDNMANDNNNKFRQEFFIRHTKSSGDVVAVVEEEDSKKNEDPRSTANGDDFDIAVEMLPGHISLKTAGKILFVGRSVTIFESSGSGVQGSSIMKYKGDEFTKDISVLSDHDTFDAVLFEETIDKIRSYVAEQLWNLMVSQSDLQLHLKHFKDFFLIGRGELFLTFIDQSQDILRKPPMIMTQHDVNVAFQHAARDLSLDEEIYQRFKFVIEVPESPTTTTTTTGATATTKQQQRQQQPSTFLNTRESGWNCLRMVADVEWPLHVMFTPGVIKKYGRLFSFLLYVKRIQLELHNCWSIEMNRRHLEAFKKHHHHHTETRSDWLSSTTTKWRLRNHMAFLVDNLQYYLQVDVIESQYCLLVDKIKSKKDFEEILVAHDIFITSLNNQCFFHSIQMSNCLLNILNLCHAFYGLMANSDITLTTAQHSQLQEISKDFDLHSSLLFRLLSKFRNSQSQSSNPHLAQLLLRIDYNKYFTQQSSANIL